MSPEALGWYASIFGWLFFTGIGIPPCPEEVGILYAAGLTASNDAIHWWLAWPMAGAGIVAADCVLYGLGRRWGVHLVEHRWFRRFLPADRQQSLEERFHRQGFRILLLARLLPPLRTGVFLVAGAIRYSFVRFLLADVGYAVIGVGLLFFGGTGVVALLHQAGHWAMYGLAALIAGYALYRYFKYLRGRELSSAPAPPVSILEIPAASSPPAAPTSKP